MCASKFYDPPLFYFLTHYTASTFIAIVENSKCGDRYLSASLRENILSQAIWLQLLDGSVNIPSNPRPCEQ